MLCTIWRNASLYKFLDTPVPTTQKSIIFLGLSRHFCIFSMMHHLSETEWVGWTDLIYYVSYVDDCEFWGSHSGENVNYCLLGCNAMLQSRRPTSVYRWLFKWNRTLSYLFVGSTQGFFLAIYNNMPYWLSFIKHKIWKEYVNKN
jgi:hypothetical protein